MNGISMVAYKGVGLMIHECGSTGQGTSCGGYSSGWRCLSVVSPTSGTSGQKSRKCIIAITYRSKRSCSLGGLKCEILLIEIHIQNERNVLPVP
jgi:hypothetical protein